MSSDGYFTVGLHGPPTLVTAPHGIRWRHADEETWRLFSSPEAWHWTHPDQWQPLPAPPVEQAPAPEPVARWSYGRDHRYGTRLQIERNPPIHDGEEAARYRDALNTLDRDGVYYGPGRPISELPEAGRVLVLRKMGDFEVWDVDDFRDLGIVVRWWSLPESGE